MDAELNPSTAAPERIWLAERSGDGWRTITFAEAIDRPFSAPAPSGVMASW